MAEGATLCCAAAVPVYKGFRKEGRKTKGQKEALSCAAQLPFQCVRAKQNGGETHGK